MSGVIVLAATTQTGLFFRVAGRATFACCADVRNYAEKLLKGDFKSIDVDLEDCTGMDSTFMGLMAMLGIERMKQGASNVVIRRAGDSNKKLLEELGLTRLFSFDNTEAPALDWLEIFPVAANNRPSVITLDSGKLMLKAHQTLMDVDAGNVDKFKDVVDSLKTDLGEIDDPETEPPKRKKDDEN